MHRVGAGSAPGGSVEGHAAQAGLQGLKGRHGRRQQHESPPPPHLRPPAAALAEQQQQQGSASPQQPTTDLLRPRPPPPWHPPAPPPAPGQAGRGTSQGTREPGFDGTSACPLPAANTAPPPSPLSSALPHPTALQANPPLPCMCTHLCLGERNPDLVLPHAVRLPRPVQLRCGRRALRLRRRRQRGQLGLQQVAAAVADGLQQGGGVGRRAALAADLVVAVAAGRGGARGAGAGGGGGGAGGGGAPRGGGGRGRGWRASIKAGRAALKADASTPMQRGATRSNWGGQGTAKAGPATSDSAYKQV